MVRDEWLNLNGLWEYAVRPRSEGKPSAAFEGPILVPFPIESALSGVGRRVSPEERLWYRRTFTVPPEWEGRKILLHFGAVDFEAEVWLNGRRLGDHSGGYDPFSFNISDALNPEGDQELVVAVWDPTDKDTQPRGKQVTETQGIWYTPVTGIWQTVWLEPVPETSIGSLKIVPDVDAGTVRVTVAVAGDTNACRVRVVAELPADDASKGQATTVDAWGELGTPVELQLPSSPAPRLWSPDSPWLYPLKVSLHPRSSENNAGGEAEPVDTVHSYFGMRKVSLGKDKDGVLRLCLNNQPIFHFGPLDQGFWPDGIYTAPTDEALRYDIEITRQMGFNMARKHIKVEPARWYYWCDRLGLLVWQDMPSGDDFVPYEGPEITRTPESAARYNHELRRMIDTLHNSPCVVIWVVFNEGWGQFDTASVAKWTKEYDPTRLVDAPSGWTDVGAGDLNDIHAYPEPNCPALEPNRAVVLGEFGGLGFPVPGHSWQDEKNWGYRTLPSPEELSSDYESLIHKLGYLIRFAGLSAAVYTQTTDVEGEINGLYTYDRALCKIDGERLRYINSSAYAEFARRRPETKVILHDGRREGAVWRYTTDEPPADWSRPDFDDSSWKEAPAGFGADHTHGGKPRTDWKSERIWLRRRFTLPATPPRNPHIVVRYKEGATVYMNGLEALQISGWAYEHFVMPIASAAAATLKSGDNVIAVACRQGPSGRFIDVGLVDVIEPRDNS